MINLKLWSFIALGGAFGALGRYAVSVLSAVTLGTHFPYGTLLANIFGAFVIGFLTFYFAGKISFTIYWQGFCIIGFLGAFTTFSTFSLQTFELLQNNQWHLAVLNIMLNLLLCLVFVFIGGICAKFVGTL